MKVPSQARDKGEFWFWRFPQCVQPCIRPEKAKYVCMRQNITNHRHTQQSGFNAAELAYSLLAVCGVARTARLQGACLGSNLLSRICLSFAGGGRYARHSPGSRELRVVERSPKSRRQAYGDLAHAVEHARHGHDRYCVALGVSEAELASLAHAWAPRDAAEFLLDVFDQAVSEVGSGGGGPGPAAGAGLEQVVSARITPRVPSREAIESVSH